MSLFQQNITLEIECVNVEVSYKQASEVELKNSEW
jgi:hypothetical protein